MEWPFKPPYQRLVMIFFLTPKIFFQSRGIKNLFNPNFPQIRQCWHHCLPISYNKSTHVVVVFLLELLVCVRVSQYSIQKYIITKSVTIHVIPRGGVSQLEKDDPWENEARCYQALLIRCAILALASSTLTCSIILLRRLAS